MLTFQYFKDFPDLCSDTSRLLSPSNSYYNCVAFAFDDTYNWWWPSTSHYWPMPYKSDCVNESFHNLFATLKAEKISNLNNIERIKKEYAIIALYIKENGYTHIARYNFGLSGWSSKLGSMGCIFHKTVEELEGQWFGECCDYYRIPIPNKYILNNNLKCIY